MHHAPTPGPWLKPRLLTPARHHAVVEEEHVTARMTLRALDVLHIEHVREGADLRGPAGGTVAAAAAAVAVASAGQQ